MDGGRLSLLLFSHYIHLVFRVTGWSLIFCNSFQWDIDFVILSLSSDFRHLNVSQAISYGIFGHLVFEKGELSYR